MEALFKAACHGTETYFSVLDLRSISACLIVKPSDFHALELLAHFAQALGQLEPLEHVVQLVGVNFVTQTRLSQIVDELLERQRFELH